MIKKMYSIHTAGVFIISHWRYLCIVSCDISSYSCRLLNECDIQYVLLYLIINLVIYKEETQWGIVFVFFGLFAL